jgi:hypothetical protein
LLPLKVEGLAYGRLTIVKRVARDKNGSRVQCRCSCDGKSVVVYLGNLRRRGTTSCGCWASEAASKRNWLHGKTKTVEYHAWSGMLDRCYNKNGKSYPGWGGRGIKVCKRWRGEKGFINFLADVGLRPEGKTLDRINVNGDYRPSNVRWASVNVQAKNRRRMAAIESFSDEVVLAEVRRRNLVVAKELK